MRKPIHHVRCIGERSVFLGNKIKLDPEVLEDDSVSELPRHLVLGGEGELEEVLVELLLDLLTVVDGEGRDSDRSRDSNGEGDLGSHDGSFQEGLVLIIGQVIFKAYTPCKVYRRERCLKAE